MELILLTSRRWLVPDGLDPLDDEADLFVVVVAVAGGAEVASGGDALAGGFVGEVATNFFG